MRTPLFVLGVLLSGATASASPRMLWKAGTVVHQQNADTLTKAIRDAKLPPSVAAKVHRLLSIAERHATELSSVEGGAPHVQLESRRGPGGVDHTDSMLHSGGSISDHVNVRTTPRSIWLHATRGMETDQVALHDGELYVSSTNDARRLRRTLRPLVVARQREDGSAIPAGSVLVDTSIRGRGTAERSRYYIVPPGEAKPVPISEAEHRAITDAETANAPEQAR